MSDPLADARHILERAVAKGITPGAQLAVVLPDGETLRLVVGGLNYAPDAQRVTPATVYDLASLTKPLTALAWVLSDVDLATPLASFLPAAHGTQAGSATLDALLSHRAGMIPWAPLYEAVPMDIRGMPSAREAIVRAALAQPVERDGHARYSDLGYILAGEALAAHTGLSLAQAVEINVLRPLGLTGQLTYRGVGPTWKSSDGIAPTEDCPWRGLVVGEVHDDNAWTMGGVAGHAGIFGTADALAALGTSMLDALAARSSVLSQATAFAMLSPRTGGTHRLGWDGRSPEGSSSGSILGPKTFGHLGFTGASLWCDPARKLTIALVTNRVHPRRDNLGIRALRPALYDAVARAVAG